MTYKTVARTFAWLTGLAIAAALLLSALMPVKAHAQVIARPLTAYTIYATGASFTSPVSIGQRYGVSASNGGLMILRLVSPLSFYFNIAPSAPGDIAANLSSYFLPANEVGWFRVQWGSWLAVITPTVLNSAAGRAIIHVTEME